MVRKRFVVISMFLAATALSAWDFPRIEPDRAVLEISAKEGPFDADSFITYALTLSGADSEALNDSFNKIDDLTNDIKKTIPFGQPQYETGKQILEYLHARVFTRYSELQTRLDILLDNGVYNCVSSSILYMFFAKLYKLDIRGSATSDHAFCSLVIDNAIVDIETTSQFGFDPGKKLEFHDSFGNTTGFAYVPPSDYKNRFVPTETDMLSYILQNRIVALQQRNDYFNSVPVAVDRYFLLNTDTSRNEMHLEFQNYLSFLNNRKRFEEGLAFIKFVTGRYGRIDILQDSADTLVYNLVVHAVNTGGLDESYTILRNYGELVTDKKFSEMKLLVAKKEISNLLSAEEYDKARQLIDVSYTGGILNKNEYVQFISILYSNSSIEIARDNGNLAAYNYILEGIKLVGRTGELKNALTVYEHNAAVEIHNNFVNAWNASDREKAKAILETGLELFPDNSILKNDLKDLE